MTDPTRDQLEDMEKAHAEGLHFELRREFCPMCETASACTICDGSHPSVECPFLNAMEVI